MSRKAALVIGLMIILGGLVGASYFFREQALQTFNTQVIFSPTTTVPEAAPTPGARAYQVESVVQGLEVPWSLVFTSPNRWLVTEREGRIREIENGQLQPEPLKIFPEVVARGEAGFMGMVLDPSYAENNFVYVCLTYNNDGQLQNKVIKLRDQGDSLIDESVVIDAIPVAQYHAGCELAFGPDGKLYITTGDASQGELAQDLSSLAGKILRINADGSMPNDNPLQGSRIYSYGHRNPQGLAWHPVTQQLWSTEHGPSGFDGPGGGDEINLIVAGGNYGWPRVSHEKQADALLSPKHVFTPAVAPASALFYRGTVFPQFQNKLFFAGLRGAGIFQVELDSTGQAVTKVEKLSGVDVGRVRELTEGPDGFIYFTTSNRDGRGTVNSGDDQIYRLVPQE